MCGIAGIVNLNQQPASSAIVQRMIDVLEHRGPDGEGIWCTGPVALGHRRLSIIDLSPAGHQPMITPDHRFVISYNGEVYNFRELRVELEELNWQFHSNTDTEVVLKSFAEWGLDAINRFNGMFAFALWDAKEKQFFLVRDRYGIKPLYYTIQGSSLIFASEIKAILQHPELSSGLDLEALLEYFTFQNLFTDKTLHKNIQILPAGCYLTCNFNSLSKTPKIHRYWDFNFQEPENPKKEEDYLEELDFLFKQAVSRQLVSDADVGSYLSGGMDSGSITAIAATQLPLLRTFTCGFDLSSASGLELNFDERQTAEAMSYQFKTEQYEVILKSGDMERILPKLAWHIEEPRVGQSYPNYYISRLASKFCKVVLAGTGGDELFGGYPWRYYRAVVNNDFEHYIDKYYAYWQRLIPNKSLTEVFAPVWNQVSDVWTRNIFRDTFATHLAELKRPEDYINHSLYFEAKTFLHGLLTIEDKLSMANSLETRVPFLDNDLVDFAMQLPVKFKLGKLNEVVRLDENDPGEKTARYFQKTNDGKLLLRKVMDKYIPQKVVEREKQGFSAPDATWFKGDSIEYVKKMLYNPHAQIYNFLDFPSIKFRLNEHIEGKKNNRLLIWSLLSVEHWCQTFLV